MKVQPDGSSSLIPVKTTEPYSSASTTRRLLPGEDVPDNNGGLLVAYSYSSPGPYWSTYPSLAKEARIARVVGTDVTADYAVPMDAWVPEDWGWFAERSIVLGDNSTGFALTDYSALTAEGNWVDQVTPNKVVSFNVETGAVNWTWQPPQGSVELVSATEGGGVVIRLASAASPRWIANQVVRLDSTGQATYDPWTAQDPQYFAQGWIARGSYINLEAELISTVPGSFTEPAESRAAEPALKLQAESDCADWQGRHVYYNLLDSTNQTPFLRYTVFELQTDISLALPWGVSPLAYGPPYNRFEDHIRPGGQPERHDSKQMFVFGLGPGQALYRVKRIERRVNGNGIPLRVPVIRIQMKPGYVVSGYDPNGFGFGLLSSYPYPANGYPPPYMGPCGTIQPPLQQ